MIQRSGVGRPNPTTEREIHSDLVETLFGTPGAFVAGVFGGLIAPLLGWMSTGEKIYLYMTGFIGFVGLYRIYVLIAHAQTPVALRRRDAKTWEKFYALGGIGFMTAVGCSAALIFFEQKNSILSSYGVVTMMSGIGALAGRNAGRPHIVLGQVIGLAAPMALGALLQQDLWYWGLALIMILLIIAMNSTSKFLYANLVAALRNGREARIQKERFDTALNNMSHGLCMVDAKGVLCVVNSRFSTLFGIEEELIGCAVREMAEKIVAAKQLSRFEALAFIAGFERHINKSEAGTFTAMLGERIFDFRCDPMEDGGFVVVVDDVTESRLASRKIEHMAMFDALTGLANRIQFRDRIQTAIEHVDARGYGFSVLYVDLDLFKEVNDTLGHPIGDKLLEAVSKRLLVSVRDRDLVARFGGDEFLILHDQSSAAANLDTLCEHLIATVSAPYVIDDNTIVIGASIGTATAPRDGRSADDIIKNADMALYHAKANGRGCFRHFDSAMDEKAQRKRRIEADLRKAVANGELDLFYQPIVDVRTGRINAFEALLRWRHATHGLVSPALFIPLAEESGLIVEIGEWALERACRDAATWPDEIRVAVNFSPIQFRRCNIVDMLTRALTKSGLAANRLEVEVTETIVLQDTEATLRVFQELADFGVRLALDDFGTGYSSLSYLNRFPFHKVKIDRAFIKDLEDPKSLAVISAVMHLARELDLSLVVEGVETADQLRILSQCGVHEMQGFLFSAPKPLAEIAGVTMVSYTARLTQAA